MSEALKKIIDACEPIALRDLISKALPLAEAQEQEIARLREALDWQPIESAPKHLGALIDLWCASRDGVEQWRETNCWWNADTKLWCNLHIRLDESSVTHWRQRPPSPAALHPTPEPDTTHGTTSST